MVKNRKNIGYFSLLIVLLQVVYGCRSISVSRYDLKTKEGVVFLRKKPYTGKTETLDLYLPLRVVASYKNGLKEGVEKCVDQNDSVLWSLEWHDGKLNGNRLLYNYKHRDVLRLKESYRNGLKDGWCEYFDSNGFLSTRKFYEADRMLAYCTFTNGREDRRWEYVDGEKIITWTRYYANGSIQSITVTDSHMNRLDYKEYYSSGQLKIHDDKMEGTNRSVMKKYFKNGNLEYVSHYQNGKMHGETSTYYKNGQIRRFKTYVKGEINGVFKTYYEDGQLETTGTYIKDQDHMENKKSYYPDGTLESEVERMVNNKFDGYYRKYYENGVLEYEGKFVKDKAIGIWKWYKKNGSLDVQRTYGKK